MSQGGIARLQKQILIKMIVNVMIAMAWTRSEEGTVRA